MPDYVHRMLAAAGLIVLAPVIAAISVILVLSQGRPVTYKGERHGRHGQVFSQLKFRTMVNNADALLVDGAVTTTRVTRVGKVLRKTSLDEIPQLVNVVRGEMALVGPRPLIGFVHEKIDPAHARFTVLPGITGLAQLSGRNELPWSRRLELDAQYVAGRTVKQDVGLLARTIVVALRGSGVAADRNTSEVFDL